MVNTFVATDDCRTPTIFTSSNPRFTTAMTMMRLEGLVASGQRKPRIGDHKFVFAAIVVTRTTKLSQPTPNAVAGPNVSRA